MKKYLYISILICLAKFGFTQTKYLSLEDVLSIAQERSPDALIAKNKFRTSYWQFKFYKAEQLPALKFIGTVPSIDKSIVKEDIGGVTSFYSRDNLSINGGLEVNQIIPWTGGTIKASSSLERTTNYLQDSTGTIFRSAPIFLELNQPLFQFNEYKWDRKIEPIKYAIAKKQYLSDVESVSEAAIKAFFDLYEAQMQLEIATFNYQNYDTLFKVANGRYGLGRIGENEVLQMELSLLKAKSAVERYEMAVENAMLSLKSFLRLRNTDVIELLKPNPVFFDLVEFDFALEKAKSNSIDYLNFEQRLLEARREVVRAKSYGFQSDLYVAYGLNASSDDFTKVYNDPADQQILALGINVPILDWGRRKGQMKIAESNEELVKTSVEQERADFAQSIRLRVGEFNIQKNQVLIAAKSDTIAQKSFNVTKNRYLIGKIGVTDLNIAQKETDEATLSYINSLRTYWINYFLLRKATLFNFEEGKDLDVSYEDIYGD